jgi:SAM-dependent methyltransferase
MSISPISPTLSHPTIHWTEAGQPCSARWRSERGTPPPKKVVLADDTLNADTAYKLACEGTALLWRGDFQNARHMLQALGRRIDQSATAGKRSRERKGGALATKKIATNAMDTGAEAAKGFHLHRQAQAQRARVLSMVLLSFDADYGLSLRRAPDARLACTEGWGAALPEDGACVASLRELLALISAHEWRKKGVEVPALGAAPHNRIYPYYGVFSPLRGEYVALVAQAPLPASYETLIAFDIGTGTGVLSAVLVRRGVGHVVATDQDPRALMCATENLQQLGVAERVEVQNANLFPVGQAALIVCNPPWLPARAGSPIEHAVYDEGSGMLLGFLNGLAAHLAPGGEGWLILSDLAEHLGLRSRDMLLKAIADAGLQVVGRIDTKPVHSKAQDLTDALHAARSREVTSLWRLGVVEQLSGEQVTRS